ncbi:GH36-type glycosyl hydrolase domain-containing protein [Gorillibacterium massiliense]|uniref:GH36-type glycosyl hydrolase domain-containing protein n=1 Tax=Gorillibacterium massiliense TaxID=1280390 RepID=UPI0004B0811D|nr:glycosyl transferase [Gorillibacterium massiliense]
MRYGSFDNEKKEYRIDNPNTPMSWVNYLGTDEYCGIVSNNASGYGFHKSPKSGRMLRFRFNSVPTDRPGRYLYIRDEADGDYWSASWQPVGKPLDQYKSVCRHGMGYTIFESEYKGIRSNYRLFVPVDKPLEFWELEIENTTNETKELSLFTYAEWCFWDMNQDLSNFQYILYTCRMDYEQDIIDYSLRLWPMNEPKAYLASTLPVASFDTDREAFIGRYRHEGQPIALENGACSNSIAIGGNPCASVQNKITLAPGEKAYALYIVGVGDAKTTGREYKELYSDRAKVEEEFAKVQRYWASRMEKIGCDTPSDEVNTMVNIWNQYQCHMTFNWSRSASFNEAGGRDGLGYRDTNQDILGVVHAIPDQVREKLIDLLKGQLSSGAAMHGLQPLTWTQGPHNIPQEAHIFSDDHLWLLLSIPAYLKETGDFTFLRTVIPYADAGEAAVYTHMAQALEFSWEKRGPHGLLLGLAADWNDCINLKGKGESIWSTFLYYRGLQEFIALAERLGRKADVEHYSEYSRVIRMNLDQYAWDGDWFLRGYLDSGKKLGGKESEQCHIFINAQTWSAVSGAADRDKALRAMDSLKELLATEHGINKNYPAYREHDAEIGAITTFPPGLKENAGIFCHSNTWAVIAEAMLGRGDRAFEFYRSFLPAAKNDDADLYTMEPYVYSQFITGSEHPYHFGRARNSWLTGTASWAFVSVSQYILGVRADYDGLVIDPCIPTAWDGFQVNRSFQGKSFEIQVKNPNAVSSGVAKLTVNGTAVPGNLIPFDLMKDSNTVEVVLG